MRTVQGSDPMADSDVTRYHPPWGGGCPLIVGVIETGDGKYPQLTCSFVRKLPTPVVEKKVVKQTFLFLFFFFFFVVDPRIGLTRRWQRLSCVGAKFVPPDYTFARSTQVCQLRSLHSQLSFLSLIVCNTPLSQQVIFAEPGAARDLASTCAPTTELRSPPQSSRFFHSTNHNRWLIKIMFRTASRVPISCRRGSLRSECLNQGLRLAQLILHRSPRRPHQKMARTARLPIPFQILLPHFTPNPSSAVQSPHCHTRWVVHHHKGNL
ncbi:hypothetical protein EDD15DRAFT_1167274 [Pisolithus albus]|nr:hypothetical protein EDD15DRAFT_1167274 [Pisolithus albus]